MAQVTLDECLNPALRAKIKKLVELDLDSDSIWDLLDPNLTTYEEYMYIEVEKYVKYVLWLRENNRPLDQAYEKYKNYTQTFNRNFKRDLSTRLELEQKRKDQARIDQLSALMRYSHQQKIEQPKDNLNEVEIENKISSNAAINQEINEKSILELNKNQDSKRHDLEQLEIDDEGNENFNDGEDTESDLDFVDLTSNQKNEPSLTLNTKDLLFETMTSAANEIGEMTIGLPVESTIISKSKNEKSFTTQSQLESSKTNEALAFYHQLEAKYGDFEEKNLSPIATYELGSKINYQNQEHLIIKIETLADFFNQPEVIITLQNIVTQEITHVNRKKIENEK